MDNSKFDRLLYFASQYAGQPELDLYNSTEEVFTPSKKYNRRMHNFLKRAERQEKWTEWKSITVPLKRIAVAVMLVCTVSLGCILSISAVREAIWKTIVSWYEEYIEVLFVADEDVVAPTEILVYKDPTSGLDGYERFEIVRTAHSYCIEYELSDKIVVYEQSALGYAPLLLTNSDSILYDITVSNNSGVYAEYTLNDTNYIGLTWNDGIYQYSLDGNISLDELVAIAESVE